MVTAFSKFNVKVEGKSNSYSIERRIPSSDKSYPYTQYKIVRENNLMYCLEPPKIGCGRRNGAGGGTTVVRKRVHPMAGVVEY